MVTVPLPQEFVAPSRVSECFDELYRSLYQPLVKFARRRLPSSSDPEDVVQESFVKVMERIDPAVIESAPSYLTTVVRNGVIGELRTRAAQERATARLAEPEKPDPLSRIEEHELSEAVNKLSSELPSRQRRFISLYAIGLSPAEIARVESAEGRVLTANQVSCTLSRATTRLRSLLEGRGFAFVFGGTADVFRRARLKVMRIEHELGGAALHGIAHLAMAVALSVGAGFAWESEMEPVDTHPRQHFLQLENDPVRVGESIVTRGPAQRMQPVEAVDRNAVAVEKHHVAHRNERKEGAPGLIQQITDLVNDPSRIDPIQCGGLPVCSE